MGLLGNVMFRNHIFIKNTKYRELTILRKTSAYKKTLLVDFTARVVLFQSRQLNGLAHLRQNFPGNRITFFKWFNSIHLITDTYFVSVTKTSIYSAHLHPSIIAITFFIFYLYFPKAFT